jgi:hypothetical protein
MPNLGLLWQTIDPAASQDAAANQNRGETGETLVRS